MRKLFLLGAAAALTVLGPASAATRTISITSTGFSPRNITIATGDTVAWTNNDRIAHRVVVDRTTCGLTIQAGATSSCTFGNAGRFNYREPNQQGSAWRGTITVQAAPVSVTIAASPAVVRYGGATTLSGTVSNQQAGENVRVEAQVCGQASFANVATANTTAGGAWTLSAKPLKSTVYRARWKGASAQATVRVRPRVTLRKLTGGRFTVRVSAAESFAGKVVVFQRFNASRGVWVRVKFVTLRPMGGVAPTVISGATFRAAVRIRTRVRVVIGRTQVGACYVSSTSNVVRR